MKKFSWKKFLSLVLVAALVVGTLKISDVKTQAAEHKTSVTATTADGVQITKSVKSVTANDDGTATATIDLAITGADTTVLKPTKAQTDVVFVMDLSSSMLYNTKGKQENDTSKQRLTAAKNAAKAFAEGIMTEANKGSVKVGVAAFGKTASQKCALTDSLSTVESAINNLSTTTGVGTNIQAGIKMAEDMLANSSAENKIVVILSDGEPTYSYEWGSYTSEKQLNDGSKTKLITGMNYDSIEGDGSDYTYEQVLGYEWGFFVRYPITETRNNGLPTISEAYIAKNDKNITIYSIAYDTVGNSNAIYTMKNIAYDNSKFFTATSGSTTNTETAISEVLNVITRTVMETIAAAKGTSIVDTFPSYMTANEVSNTTNAIISNTDGVSQVTWSLADELGKDDSAELTITATVNLDAMAKAYADSHPTQYADKDAVKAALASGSSNNIWFDLNKEVLLSYTNASGQKITNNDIKSVEGTVNVPEGQFSTYNYDIIYKLDGVEIEGTRISKAAFQGETILINDLPAYTGNANLYDNEAKTVTLNDTTITGTSFKKTTGTDTVIVNYYSKKYTVKFVNDDNTVLQTSSLKWGETPEYTGTEPTKEADATYTYAFDGWNPDISAVNGDATYTAKYKETKINYTVIFMDYDGTVISNETYTLGENINIPSKPTRTSSNTEVYVFRGWSNEAHSNTIVPFPGTCQGDATYYAVYGADTRYYTVRFLNYDEQTPVDPDLNTSYKYDDTVVKPSVTPTRTADNTYTYTFKDWDKTVTKVTANVDYIATFYSNYIDYTVTFLDSDNKTVLGSKTYHYNDDVNKPNDPGKAADNYNTYEFAGWTTDGKTVVIVPDKVTANATYIAKYTPTAIEYTVTFYAEDRTTVLGTGTYGYGASVTQPTIPEKPADNTYTYTAKAWPAASATCTGKADYYAEYESTYIEYEIYFYNEDGETLVDENLKVSYHYGDSVTEPEHPTKPDTVSTTYAWGGWSPAYSSECKGNAEYVATFTDATRKYTITFMNGDEELQTEELEYGSPVSYKGATPTMASSNENYSYYVFTGWDNDVAETVVGDATYCAEFDEIIKYYTITFKNGDTVLQTSSLKWGETPKYTGTEPTKEADATYTYEFDGWNPAISAVNGDATYNATFEETYINYTVKFVDYNDKVISEKTDYHYGDTITAPTAPTRAADDTYTYEFSCWKSESSTFTTGDTVSGNITYKAEYISDYINYTVKFIDENGETIDIRSDYHFDDEITNTPKDQTKDADDENEYQWAGWKNVATDIIGVSPTVTGDLTYQATFSSTKIVYSVTFKFENGQTNDVKEYNWGDQITVPTDPVKAADNTYTYEFDKWSPDVSKTCNGTAVYVAQYTPTYIEYTVEFVDYNGRSISRKTNYHYDNMPEIPESPTREATAEFTYQFATWTPEVAKVTGNAVYTATYSSSVNYYTATFYDGINAEPFATNSYAYGTEYGAPGINPSKAATAEFTYTFAGWKLKDDATDTIVSFETKPVITADIAYEAVYTATKNSYKVTFVNEDGSAFENPCEATVVYGDTVNGTESAKAVVEMAGRYAEGYAKNITTDITGYYFNQWQVKNDADELVAADFNTAITGNLTVYASYISYTFGDFIVTYMKPDADAEDGYSQWAIESVHEGSDFNVKTDGPSRVSTKMSDFTFIGWTQDKAKAEPSLIENLRMADASDVRTLRQRMLAMPGMATKPIIDETSGCVTKFETVTGDIILYPVYTTTEHLYTVTFVDWDNTVIDTCSGIHYGAAATAPTAPSRSSVIGSTTVISYTFKGWDKDFSVITEDITVKAEYTSNETPLETIPIVIEDVPQGGGEEEDKKEEVPTATPTPEPEDEVEEIIPEVIETPEGDVDLDETETPEGTPDEDVDLDPELTPQGLPKTGVVAAGVLYGIGSACIALGSALTLKFRKKED